MRSSAWLTIAVVGLGVSFGLVGCGDDDDDGGGGGGGGSKAGSSSAGSSTAGKGGKGGSGGTGNNTAGTDNESGSGPAPMGGESSGGGMPGGEAGGDTGGVPSDGGSTGDGGSSLGGADGAGGAVAASTDVEVHDNVVTNADGFSLYLRDTDTASTSAPVSSCTGACLAAWPLFSVENPSVPAELSADDFRVFTRPDNGKQATYKGWPLYRYIGDTMPGDTNGKAIATWHLVKLPFVAP
jgi:predicted lipoprotein with Yx(FWY)xxD motif